jgi:hypothetical protein
MINHDHCLHFVKGRFDDPLDRFGWKLELGFVVRHFTGLHRDDAFDPWLGAITVAVQKIRPHLNGLKLEHANLPWLPALRRRNFALVQHLFCWHTVLMTLREYLARPGNTARALAHRCGVATSTITRIAAGQTPSIDYAKRIRDHTGGLVNLLGE